MDEILADAYRVRFGAPFGRGVVRSQMGNMQLGDWMKWIVSP